MNTHQLIEFGTRHSMLVTAFAAILVMLVADIIRRAVSGITDVDPHQAIRLLNSEDAVMVDIRSDKEFRSSHLANAVRIDNPQQASDKLAKFRDKPLIVYCNSGNQSVGTCGKLRKQGFERVYNLKGGILAWQKADLPISRG